MTIASRNVAFVALSFFATVSSIDSTGAFVGVL